MIRVVIPFGGDDLHRLRALGWVTRNLEASLDATVAIGRCDNRDWSKAVAVADAIDPSWADDDILVVHDGDIWIPQLSEALANIGPAPWVMPHGAVFRMNEDATARILDGAEFDTLDRGDWDQAPYRGVVGGGCVALPLASYRLCPLDPRFEGWGQEDESWGTALRIMLGQPWRGNYSLYHFWHPYPDRKSRHVGSNRGLSLRNRYMTARTDRIMTGRILDEFR